MKFLADMGVSRSTTARLRELGHDAVHLRDLHLERLPDREILERTRQEGRIVLTFDLDFGDLLAAGALPFPSVVIFRLHDQTPTSVNPRLEQVLTECQEPLTSGAIVIVEDARYRVRRLPI